MWRRSHSATELCFSLLRSRRALGMFIDVAKREAKSSTTNEQRQSVEQEMGANPRMARRPYRPHQRQGEEANLVSVIPFPARRSIMSSIAHVVMPRIYSWVAAEFRNGGSHMSEHCSDCIISKTLNGTITSWNCAAERLYGYSADEVLGRPFSMLVPKDARADLAAMDARLAQGEQIYAHAAVRLTKAGKRIGVIVAMSPIIDDDGVVVGAHGIGRPIVQQQEKKTLAETKDSFAYGYFMAQLENIYAASENVVKLAASFPDAAQYFVQQVRSGMLEAPSGQPQILGITSLLCDLAGEAADEQREGPGTGERAVQ